MKLPGASPKNGNNETNEHSLPAHRKKKEQARVNSVKPNVIPFYYCHLEGGLVKFLGEPT